MDKQFWTIVAVAIIAAVVSSFVTASMTGRATSTSLAKANSCDADIVCETRGLTSTALAKLSGGLDVQHGDTQIEGVLRSLSDVELGRYGNTNPVVVINRTSDYTKRNFIVSNDANITGSLFVEGGTEIKNKLTLSGLSTKNVTNAYVCVDYRGTLFRSSKPCV